MYINVAHLYATRSKNRASMADKLSRKRNALGIFSTLSCQIHIRRIQGNSHTRVNLLVDIVTAISNGVNIFNN